MSAQDYDKIRTDIRTLVNDVIKANVEQTDQGVFPRDNLNALAKAGWNGILIPKEYGGLGLDHLAFSIVCEEIGRVCASTGLVFVMHTGAAQTINLFGNHDQKLRWLKPAQEGLLGTYSTSEKASGGHWWFNFSEAARDGDSHYLLNADKSFTTSAGAADYYLFQTRSPGALGPTDISFFIVDAKLDGITHGVWEALGVRGNHSGPISYKNVRVDSQDRLGEEGKGKDIVYDGVTPIYLIGLGSVWHGVARVALEAAATHLTGTIHRDFNRKLSDYQVLRQQLGESKVLVESLRPWQHDLARQLDQLQADGQPQGQLLLPLTEFKVHASEVANVSARNAMDVSGGYGYKKGQIERIFRDARAGIAMGPSNNIAREWIGKDLVGLPLELFEAGGE
jgi:alkylation response protein AidB-like acyl-CoA dehydrogenase